MIVPKSRGKITHLHGVLSTTCKYDHITPTHIQLQWLAIHQRIKFKILVLTWKSLNGRSPASYSLCAFHTWTLRFSHKLLLKTPKTFSLYGDRASTSCAPKLWNSLPIDIRSCLSINTFKNHLKTYLFQSV